MALFSVLHGTKTEHYQISADKLASKLGDALIRERTALVEAIRGSTTPGARVRIKWPQPARESSDDIAADYAPYHRFYLAYQREMEAKVSALRAAVRDALIESGSVMRQLAALDEVFDKALGQRERGLMAKIPRLLEKRFVQLRETHQRSGMEKVIDEATGVPATGWLALFAREVQAALLAELETRLHPVEGLIETFSSKETEKK